MGWEGQRMDEIRRMRVGIWERGKKKERQKIRHEKKNFKIIRRQRVSKMLPPNHVIGCSIAPPVLSNANCKHDTIQACFFTKCSV